MPWACDAQCSGEIFFSCHFFACHVFYGTILTGKTWSANKDHLGQNDCQLMLYADKLCWAEPFSSKASLSTYLVLVYILKYHVCLALFQNPN
jgi:hypothetical protein